MGSEVQVKNATEINIRIMTMMVMITLVANIISFYTFIINFIYD